MNSSARMKFQNLLRDLFQFDSADLDFGIYRIMNHKRTVIEQFITEGLPKAISEELQHGTLAEQSQALEALAAARQRVLDALGDDALDPNGNLTEKYYETNTGKDYLEAQERAKGSHSTEALEADVYNHLYAFFSRYWQDGDFISKRRYSKKERYAIPYNGEEVYLYWANQNQYYVKTGEYFTDYTYQAPNGVTVHFKLQQADVEQNNLKGEKRFFLPVLDGITWNEAARTLTIPFQFRPLTGQENIAYGQKNQQESIIAKAVDDIPKRVEDAAELAALNAERRKTEKGESVTWLEYHLRQYTRRNTSDFFIHKDLRGFLSRELDFYLKNEVLNLEELEAAGEDLTEGWFQLLRLIKRIGMRIIEFLTQIENFQKALWEKKKFVTKTFYCITLGNIPEAFYPEIAACEAQWEEWKTLYGIELPPSPHRGEGRGEGIKSRTKAERSTLITRLAREMRQAPTDAEQRLWHFLRDRQLGGYKFRRQHPIDRYIADLICIEARLIVELDGGQHAEIEQQQKDEERTRFFESRGFRVLRFWNDEVLTHTEDVLAAILDAIEDAPHPNPLPAGERESFLKAHPTLPLDTRRFLPGFTDRLLASYENLDELTDGLLVHSENWQALNLLQEKYRERVKCVYIDPPYNTAASEILYKNNYKHSSWLSLIHDRLLIGRILLSKEGLQFTTIDDAEFYKLMGLITRLFGEENIIGVVAIKNNPSGRSTVKGISIAHEYGIISARSELSTVGNMPRTDEQLSQYPEEDELGKYQWRNFLRAGGANDFRSARPRLHYPLVVYGDKVRIPEMEWDPVQKRWNICERIGENNKTIWPVSKGLEYTWRLGHETLRKRLDNIRVRKIRSGDTVIELKFRIDEEGVLPKTIWDEKEVNATAYGTTTLRHLLGESQIFSFPKSIYAVEKALRTCGVHNEEFTLDFFAGSGTTGHAVINLNREDGGRRKFILVEMAEYFDTVLLPRIKKVTFSPEWKDGRPLTFSSSPQRREGRGEGWVERSPRIIKVIRLESYEDALNNLTFDDEGGQQALDRFGEDYLLRYMLRWETRRSATLLDVEQLQRPFSYKLRIYRDGETREEAVDLPETFNYLLGLDVVSRRADDDDGRRYLTYRGRLRNGRAVAIIWRETTGWTKEDYEHDRDFVAKHNLIDGADDIFVNGDSLIPGAQSLDPIFKQRMFAGVES